MSVTLDNNRKSAVSTDRFAICKLITDTGDTLAYDAAVTEITKGLISVNKTPKQNASSQYSSGQVYDEYVAKAGGEIAITSPAFNSEDEVLLFGKTLDDETGVLTNNKDDYVPNVMVIYSTTRSDGKKNLYKVMKTKFTEGATTVETSDENGVKYQATQISGKYSNLIKNGDDVLEIRGVDPETQAELINEWFSSALGGLPADKYGDTYTVTITGATNADYVTKGGAKINSGATVPGGTVLTVVLATEGTTCSSGGTPLTNGQTLTVEADTTITFTAG